MLNKHLNDIEFDIIMRCFLEFNLVICFWISLTFSDFLSVLDL